MDYGFAFGVVVSIVASLFSSVGFLLQKLSHMRKEASLVPRRRFCNLLWIAGVTCLALAAASDCVALAFVAQSVVAPLGAITLLCNLFLGPIVLGEELGPGSIQATTTITFGNLICIAFFSSGNGHSDIPPSLLVLRLTEWDMIAYSAVFVLCLVYLRRLNTQLTLTIAVGMLSSTSMMIARVLSLMTKVSLFSGRVENPLFMLAMAAVVAVTLFFQLRQIDECLQRFKATYVVPISQSSMCIWSLSHGMFCFKEYRGLGPVRLALFCAGVGITVFGQIVLSQGGVPESPSLKSATNDMEMKPVPHWTKSPYVDNNSSGEDEEQTLLKEIELNL